MRWTTRRGTPSLRCTSSKLESNAEDWTETSVRKAKRPLLKIAASHRSHNQLELETFATASRALQLAEHDKLRSISSCAARAKAARHTHIVTIFPIRKLFRKIRLRISAKNSGARDFSRLGAALLQGNSYLADGNPFILSALF